MVEDVERECPCLVGEDWMTYEDDVSEGQRMDQRMDFSIRGEGL